MVIYLEKCKIDVVEWEIKIKNVLLEGVDLLCSIESLKYYFFDWIRIYKIDGVLCYIYELYMGNWCYIVVYFKDWFMSVIKCLDY